MADDGEAVFDDEFMQGIVLDPAYDFQRDPKTTDANYDVAPGEADDAVVQAAVSSILDPGAAPQIGPPPPGEVRLPGGLVTPEGVYTTAQVRELTGQDEEALAKAGTNVVRYNTALLRAVDSIGGKKPSADVLKSLLVGDREALILGIRIATFGKDVVYENVLCACGENLDVTLDLDTLDMIVLDDREKREFEVPLRKGVAEVRLTTVADSDLAMELASKDATGAEQNTLILSRCVLNINGEPVKGSKEKVKNLSVSDRQTILKFLAEKQPGPRYDEVKSKHEECGNEIPLYLAVDNLFRGL